MFKNLRYTLALSIALTGLMNAADLRVSTEDALKAVVKKTPPDYPSVARQMKVGGKVAVDVTIDAEGNVEDVKILSGNALLTNAAVSAVKKWKFTPFTQSGNPVKAIAAIDFDFKM